MSPNLLSRPRVRLRTPQSAKNIKKPGIFALVRVVQRPAGQGRDNQAHVGRKLRREPYEIRRAVTVFQLIEGIQNEHHARTRRRLIQCIGEGGAEGFRFCR